VFERFTERARRVIILAREEAGRFRHDFVGTEHVLLGLIRDGEGIATAVLQRLGLRLETVKAEVERALAGFPKTLTFGEVPFTPQAKRVLELSIEEARQLGHNYIGTEHLLLGLMKEGQSIAAKILESLGARLDEVRQETLALLGDQYYPRPKKRSQTPVLDVLGGVPIVLVIGDDQKSIRVFDRTLDGRTLELMAKAGAQPLRLLDAETGSEWDFSGRALSGPLAGRQLTKVKALKEYWFDWKIYQPATTVYARGASLSR